MTQDSIPQDDPSKPDKCYWLWSRNGSDSEDYDDFEGPFDSVEDAQVAFTHGYYPYVGTIFNDGDAVSECYDGKWQTVNE